ncbi:MAG: gliding motility-associated C-terminal domain-containing protein [Crocinitomicaceae bacterium]|nr:gliding motility-associated C-terminal domain-containing protein [Crocinitomicaceae bacterium]
MSTPVGPVSVCGGTFMDNNGNSPYSNNFYTMTLCPDTPGQAVQLSFSIFSLQTSPNPMNSDFFRVYDGPTTSSMSLGIFTGTDLQGMTITATTGNPTGCLTIEFDPNGGNNTNYAGFQAAITCTAPCAPPTAVFGVTPPPIGSGNQVMTCPGEMLTFSDLGSSAQSGASIVSYSWHISDGTNLAGSAITHAFNDPGEYHVYFSVTDNNGCNNIGVAPLSVLVSTEPEFPGVAEIQTEYCFGEEVVLDAGEVVNTSWSALPPQVISGQTYLPDGNGVSYSSSLTFDFFTDGAVLENCSDLNYILVNMEHSYMGDLGVAITCPNGTTVDLVQWGSNGGGGTFLGEAVDDEGITPGVGYDYFWSPDATNGTWGQNANGTILPSGIYQSSEDLCALVGCPLNGTWLFTVSDNLSIDNGYIFGWGIDFNPALIPGVLTFTPTIGADADSSYWSGPFIVDQDAGFDVITVEFPQPGNQDFTYHVMNSFGCAFDTIITIEVTPPPLISAGSDQLFGCVPLQIDGGFVNLPTPQCSVAEGTYTYCYGNNSNYTVTYCPDNPGDGISAVELSFSQGGIETGWDLLTIYNGNSTSAPILATVDYADLSGLSWTSTSSDGCLTLALSSDFIVSCADGGGPISWIYTVSCASTVDYIWSWSPSTGLSDPSLPSTTLNNLNSTTQYTLTGYPSGHPDCVVSDDVLITVPTNLVVDIVSAYELCSGDTAHIAAPVITGGLPPFIVEWVGDDGSIINGNEFDVTVDQETTYCVTVTDDCDVESSECTTVSVFPVVPASFSVQNPIGCEPLNISLVADYTAYDDISQMTWHFGNGDSTNTIGSAGYQYTSDGIFFPWVEIVDVNGCITSDTAGSAVNVWPKPFASFTTNPVVAVLPNTTFEFINNTIDGTDYEWVFAGQDAITAYEAEYSFPSETAGTYWVDLNVSNEYGCVDTTHRQLIIRDDIDIYIPNSFTPNEDGINDEWMIQGRGYRDEGFHLQVFNRWGDIVFESFDPQKAWTGNYRDNNYYVEDGAYSYRASIRDKEFDVNHIYEGHVVLIR